jgi:hypothetical protein
MIRCRLFSRKVIMLKLNNPNAPQILHMLDVEAVMNCYPRHIQSVLEDLHTLSLQGRLLADEVMRINPTSGEIGEGFARNLQSLAKGLSTGK